MITSNPFARMFNGVASIAKPVILLAEAGTESANAFASAHTADLAAKTARADANRATAHAALAMKAQAKTAKLTIEGNQAIRDAQLLLAADSVQAAIHDNAMSKLVNISEDTLAKLASKSMVTTNDIMKAAGVGSIVSIADEASAIADELTVAPVAPTLDINRWKKPATPQV